MKTAAAVVVATAIAAPPILMDAAQQHARLPRGGENCQLSPTTGLPPISMPAGFTADGVPIGVELLGAAWSEPELLGIAYAYEQATRPRRPPPPTPALVDGKAPPAVSFTIAVDEQIVAAFTFDPVSGRLSYEIVTGQPVLEAAVHRGTAGQTGPVIDAMLSPADREAFADGGLYLAVRTNARPARILRAQINPRRLP